MLEPDESPDASLHDELHEADLRVEGVLPEVVLAEELGVVRPRHGDRVLAALVDVGVVQEVKARADKIAQFRDLEAALMSFFSVASFFSTGKKSVFLVMRVFVNYLSICVLITTWGKMCLNLADKFFCTGKDDEMKRKC